MPLAERNFNSTAAWMERSNDRKARSPAGHSGDESGEKRSSKEMRSGLRGNAADATAGVRSESAIQATTPSTRASAARTSAAVSDHPMRRRSNTPSAIAASKVIKSPTAINPDSTSWGASPHEYPSTSRASYESQE